MALDYKRGDRDQLFLLPPSMRDWLPPEHLVWFVVDLVAAVDTSAFHARHPNDGPGRPAYDPEAMLTLLVYAYCWGTRSSRRIAAACETDVAFKVAGAGLTPDHRTIAAFRAAHESALRAFFVDVLRVCAAAGLASLGTIAIDGTKIGADAALRANRSEASIRAEVEKILAEAAAADDSDGAVQPTLMGDLPEPLAQPSSRLARLEAALGEIEAQDRARRAEADDRAAKAAAEAAQGRKLRGRKPADPHAALARAESDLVAAKAKAANAKGERATERAQREVADAEAALAAARERAASAPPPELQANTTDPESRIMKTASGWVQGFNAQAAVNEHQIVVAPDVTADANDVGQLVPMMQATEANARAAGIDDTVGRVLGDAGYWSEDNAHRARP